MGPDPDDQMQGARNRFRSVFEQSNDAIVIFDPEDDTILEANARATEMLGYPREELLSLGPSDIHPDEMEQFRSFVRTVQTEGSGWTRTLSCLDSSGEKIAVEVSAPALEFGGRASVLALLRDVSGRQAYRRELEQQNERLAEFTGVVSHDLRNPLDVAQGRVALAREECDSEHLAAAERALDRMETLIDDLLALARSGTELDREAVELGSLAENCWRNVETHREVDDECTIRADRNRLQQLIESLIRNAVEHAGDDVTVTVGALEGGVYVADDGPGIPVDRRERVFEHGYSTDDNGTGLGLTIVERVVEDHGWELDVTESADGGTRFEVTGVETG